MQKNFSLSGISTQQTPQNYEEVFGHVTRISTATRSSGDFSDITTLRIGGTPLTIFHCTSPTAATRTIHALDEENIPALIVGGGSNLVMGQDVENMAVVRLEPADAEAEEEDIVINQEFGIITATCGARWDDVVKASVAAGLGGLECLSGIPGNAGATPVQNVGAYGVEVSQYISRVELYDRETGAWIWHNPEDLDMGYRTSNLKYSARALVTRVEFVLNTDGLSAPIRYGELAKKLGATESNQRFPVGEVRDAVLELRAGKGMVLDPDDSDTYSAGSFFTNPVVTGQKNLDTFAQEIDDLKHSGMLAQDVEVPQYVQPNAPDGQAQVKLPAAWLIEHAGIGKGWYITEGNGRARVSSKHTLALTNYNHADSADIVALAHAVQSRVKQVFGIELTPEPLVIGVEI